MLVRVFRGTVLFIGKFQLHNNRWINDSGFPIR
jgi:hypothetical protein